MPPPTSLRLGLASNEVGFILFGAGLLVAYLSISGVVGNYYDMGPLCSNPQSFPACSSGVWLIIVWEGIAAGAVAMIIIGVFLALRGKKIKGIPIH